MLPNSASLPAVAVRGRTTAGSDDWQAF